MALGWRKPPWELEDIAALYDAHGAKLYAYALSLLGCISDAEDAVQDVFAGLQEQRQWPENPGGYLYRASRNAAYTRLRKRRVPLDDAPLSEQATGERNHRRLGIQ